MVDVVEVNRVALRQAFRVAPAPTDGDTRVTEIADVVVRHLVVAALSNPHAHRAHEIDAAGADDIVINGDVMRAIRKVGLNQSFTDAHAARAQVVKVSAHKSAIVAAASKPDAVNADVPNLAIFNRNPPRAVRHDDRGNRERRLSVTVSLRRQNVMSVLKTKSFQGDVFHPLPHLRLTGEAHKLLHDGRDDFGFRHILAGQRLVVKSSLAV